jgi:hypothetical protein
MPDQPYRPAQCIWVLSPIESQRSRFDQYNHRAWVTMPTSVTSRPDDDLLHNSLLGVWHKCNFLSLSFDFEFQIGRINENTCGYQKVNFGVRARNLVPQSYRPHHTRLQHDASSSLRQDLCGNADTSTCSGWGILVEAYSTQAALRS